MKVRIISRYCGLKGSDTVFGISGFNGQIGKGLNKQIDGLFCHSGANYTPSMLEALPKCFSLREEARKSWNYFFTDVFVHLEKGLNCDFNIPLVAKLNAYPWPWMEIQLRLGGKREDEYRIIIEYLLSDGWDVSELGEKHLDIPRAKRNMPVFVRVPENVQPPEMSDLVGIPTVVRLKRSDYIDSGCGDASGSGRNSVLSLGIILPDDRKRGLSGRIIGREKRELPCEMIEGRSQTRYEVTSNQSQAQRRRFQADCDAVLSALYIVLRRDSMGIGFRKGMHRPIERVQVYLRPFNLQCGIQQTRHNAERIRDIMTA
jgi:hypothetical protein